MVSVDGELRARAGSGVTVAPLDPAGPPYPPYVRTTEDRARWDICLKTAVAWSELCEPSGVADSQFNLGILYARGIGVEQNLAESFKWFSLAAAQGDADSSRKRDDIAKRLDAQSLAAAKLAIQTFTPEPQPDDAVNAAAPQGGWDSAPADRSTRPVCRT